MEKELREPVVVYGKASLLLKNIFRMKKSSQEKHEYYQGEIFAMSGLK